ncbi:hypothetical protein C1645_811658 [Glomus cerebriforme]|uniref:F-box domain-containing protein n=1 Tax=Glomus cerebriforme TaxID=658196 RepID=A0A397TLV8_9GLOM|nr:hypothetical protein C1645_811658 [Glomus cerebriforme]
MGSSLLPYECFNDVLSFLDHKSLYKCLFVNRYYCKFSIPLIWKDPFITTIPNKISLINTLMSCLNEDEISSLIPYEINFNNQSPLFEYGKFVGKIDHDYCVNHIIAWLRSSSSERISVPDYIDKNRDKVRKLTSIIYHMIMRKGSNLREFILFMNSRNNYIDLPKFSIFTTYKPGISNLSSLNIEVNFDFVVDEMRYLNTIEFLNMVSKFCNGIVNCEFWISDLNSTLTKPFLDIIKSQPLKRIFIDTYINNSMEKENVKNVLNTLEFRSKTLKELLFKSLDFQFIDLSFISKLECLEQLEFVHCRGFTLQYYETLFKKKFHLKDLKLWYDEDYHFNHFEIKLNIMVAMIHSFCGDALLKLSLDIITPETVKVIKESCPNIRFLHIKIFSDQSLDSTIPSICDLSSLKILKIESEIDCGNLVKILGDCLTFVEYLVLDFLIDVLSFKYFTNKCKANLKKWIIYINSHPSFWEIRKDYLTYVNNYQKIHNSLKIFGINVVYCTKEEMEIVDSLKSQGINIVLSNELDIEY